MAAKNKEPDLMDKLVSLCKRRGFIFQSSEIYGGITSCWDLFVYRKQLDQTHKPRTPQYPGMNALHAASSEASMHG